MIVLKTTYLGWHNEHIEQQTRGDNCKHVKLKPQNFLLDCLLKKYKQAQPVPAATIIFVLHPSLQTKPNNSELSKASHKNDLIGILKIQTIKASYYGKMRTYKFELTLLSRTWLFTYHKSQMDKLWLVMKKFTPKKKKKKTTKISNLKPEIKCFNKTFFFFLILLQVQNIL